MRFDKKQFLLKLRDNEKKLYLFVKIILILTPLILWLFIYIDFNVILNNEQTTLWVHAPSTVETDEEFEITVEAWDQYERIAGGYTGKIYFNVESYNYTTLRRIPSKHDLPGDHRFTSNVIWGGLIPAYKTVGEDNGKKKFDASISTPGIHYIIVEDSGEEYRSNPIIVKPKDSEFLRLYWGDIHGHTELSDGSGTPEEAYEFARDVALLDFAALTDHTEYFTRMGDVDVFNSFNNYIEITNSFNDPGEFATLIAVEWTPRTTPSQRQEGKVYGHLNVYFEGDDMPFFSSLTHETPDKLYDYIKEKTDDDFLAWTHHTLRSDYASDYAFYDEDINTLIEVYSVHGSCETSGDDTYFEEISKLPDDIDGYSARDALRMGRRFGFIASGDSHDGRLGHSISHTDADAYNQYPYTLAGYRLGHAYPNGLAGIFASKLSRKQIFNALKTRSCYGTTGVNRHYIEFSINNISVGVNDSTVYVPQANSTRHIEILVCADGVSMGPDDFTEIEEIEIYKNSKLWKSYEDIDKLIKRIVVNDTVNITGTKYSKDKCVKKSDGKWYIHENSLKAVDPGDLNTDGFDYYYVRMRDTNGGAAWIGPIWVGPK